jgi:septal ring factor EnvC (AmiA/AmiB activator)
MISLLPPLLLLVLSLAWAGFTFAKQSDLTTEKTKLRQTVADLNTLRARNADLRERQTLPQEIERLKRENAQLPEVQSELQKLTQRKAALEKELAEKKRSLQQELLSKLLYENRTLSDQIPELLPNNGGQAPEFPAQDNPAQPGAVPGTPVPGGL